MLKLKKDDFIIENEKYVSIVEKVDGEKITSRQVAYKGREGFEATPHQMPLADAEDYTCFYIALEQQCRKHTDKHPCRRQTDLRELLASGFSV